MSGKMKIKGNMAAAMKFSPDLIPSLPAAKLWIFYSLIYIYVIYLKKKYKKNLYIISNIYLYLFKYGNIIK